MALWDWPNQQIVRADHSGPGMNTPAGIVSDAFVTYGHAGLSYEFMLKTTAGDTIEGETVDWDFGDGDTAADVDSAAPATHTYDAPGHYTVSGTVDGRVRLQPIEVTGD